MCPLYFYISDEEVVGLEENSSKEAVASYLTGAGAATTTTFSFAGCQEGGEFSRKSVFWISRVWKIFGPFVSKYRIEF